MKGCVKMNTNRTILLYGIGGADKMYGVLNYFCIFDDGKMPIVRTIFTEAERLRAINPSVVHVYAIDNRHGLRKDYLESIRLHSIESHMLFKDILEREGRMIF